MNMKAQRKSKYVTWGPWVVGVVLVFVLYLIIDPPYHQINDVEYAIKGIGVAIFGCIALWQLRKERRKRRS